MQLIPIIGQGKEGTEIQNIRSTDIVKIERINQHEFRVHTQDSMFVQNFSLETLEEWLYEEGFRLLDRNNLVNIHHISQYDLDKGKVWLGHPQNAQTKTATVARSQYKHLQALLHLLKSNPELQLDEDMTGTYTDSSTGNDLSTFQRSYNTFLIVAERMRTEAKIQKMAYHDALTGLPNRLLLRERMEVAIQQAQHANHQSAVLFLDLDRIKVVNDTLGHHVGDQLLIHWSSQLDTLVAQEGTVARFSGDEFIVLLPNVTSLEFVHQMVERIMKLFQTPFVYSHHELYNTASIGIALYPRDGTDADTLLKFADSAMYRAKGRGGNTFSFYSPKHNERSLDRLNLESDLRKAVERCEIVLHYQPIIDLASGRMTGMESLIRWMHPKRGLISPMEFIPLAEETGLIVPIGTWVLEEACRQNKEWQLQGLPPVVVSVNISVKQFQQPDFVQTVRHALTNVNLSPNMLCLEITENVAMTHVTHVIGTINELRELGVAISIDDFGTGYSSLSYLKRFRVHTLKIDKSFIHEVNTDEESAAIVTALIAMSKRLNIRTLAEGVETAEQLAFLQEHGCLEIQGYFFSKPLPAEQFQQLLQEDRIFWEATI